MKKKTLNTLIKYLKPAYIGWFLLWEWNWLYELFRYNIFKLFLWKHDKIIFDAICEQIKSEEPNKYNDKYLETIFKVEWYRAI